MKFTVYSSLFIVSLLLTTNYLLPTTLAQNTCSYAQNCSFEGLDPSQGQQSCTGTIQGGICKYDPGVEPNCSGCQAINQPTPTIISSPTPIQAGREETAVYNFNQGLIPKEVIREAPEEKSGDFLSQLLAGITSLFSSFISNSSKLFAQSETINKASVPQEVHPPSNNPLDLIKGFLGGSGGVYGVSLPKEVQSGDIKGSEAAYEKANFPEGIKPITGQ